MRFMLPDPRRTNSFAILNTTGSPASPVAAYVLSARALPGVSSQTTTESSTEVSRWMAQNGLFM